MQFCSLSHFPSILLQLGIMRVCRCHGMFGSCQAKTCKWTTRQYAEIAQSMSGKYKSAFAVSMNSHSGQLESVHPANNPTSDDLVYSCDTPCTCHHNKDLGIPGTSGRKCNPTDTTAPNFCDCLCNGRGHYEVTKEESVECMLPYCCREECKVVRTTLVIKYYCRRGCSSSLCSICKPSCSVTCNTC